MDILAPLLCTVLISLVLILLLYGVYRFMAPVRHDLANKTMHYEVLLALCKILEERELDDLIIEATERLKKNEKHN
jgi:hypothetical protein